MEACACHERRSSWARARLRRLPMPSLCAGLPTRATVDRRSPRATACAHSGRPPVAPTAGSGDPRHAAHGGVGRPAPRPGDLRSHPRRGRETRASGRPPVAPTAGSGDPRRALAHPRRGRETRAAALLGTRTPPQTADGTTSHGELTGGSQLRLAVKRSRRNPVTNGKKKRPPFRGGRC